MYRTTLMATAVVLACQWVHAADSDNQQAGTRPAAAGSENTPAKAGRDETLKSLEWMVGDWEDRTAESVVVTSIAWARNKSFLLWNFKVSVPGMEDLTGTQVIGFDPQTGGLRSWIFDSNGGYGDGQWTQKDNHWIVKSSMTLAGGAKATTTQTYTRIDDNAYSWQATERKVGDKSLPDTQQFKVVRMAADGVQPTPNTKDQPAAHTPDKSEDSATKKPAADDSASNAAPPAGKSDSAAGEGKESAPAAKEQPDSDQKPASDNKPAPNEKETP